MMLRILRDKFIRLGRDEEGVAMVVTLAIFMFMYLVCMGVYAIGTAVKTRIHLQNACDAAAYSAAVVQADTLSRIATLNRAMSWTYIAMTKRQMDYIVWKWLNHTRNHCDKDSVEAWQKGCEGVGCGTHPVWYVGPEAPLPIPPLIPVPPYYHPLVIPIPSVGFNPAIVSLNGHTSLFTSPSVTEIGSHLSIFEKTWFRNESFYSKKGMGIGVLQKQILADKKTIEEMGVAIDDLLATQGGLPQKIENCVEKVVEANVPVELSGRYNLRVFQSDNPKAQYTRVLKGNEESRFLDFSRYDCDKAKPFGTGSAESEWFPLLGKGDIGIQRRYNQKKMALVSKWHVAAWNWECDPPYVHIPTPVNVSCKHMVCDGHTDKGLCDKNRDELEALHLWEDDYYVGQRAMPRVLTKDYFSKNGTITVGIAVKNQNPWTPILGTAIKGIFSAFNIGEGENIGEDVFPLYMVCFASAKAGYKEKLNWENSQRVEDERVYRVDWQNEEDWNLRQSDWDAELIPVRRAESLALGGEWRDGNMNFLEGYANKLGVDSTEMLAGGDELDIDSFYGSRNLGEEYRFGNQSGFWGGADMPIKQEPNAVKAKWQIGNPHHPVDWNAMQKVMLH